MTWKKLGHLASRMEFAEHGDSPLKYIKQGLSLEHRAEWDLCVENESCALRRIRATVTEGSSDLSSHSERP
jgi:hypothetical protein